jgi:hypothetical protein
MRKVITEEEKLEAQKKVQVKKAKRLEQCHQCRFHEPLSEPVEKRKCTNKEAKGTITKSDSCPFFQRRWPTGIEPVELEE